MIAAPDQSIVPPRRVYVIAEASDFRSILVSERKSGVRSGFVIGLVVGAVVAHMLGRLRDGVRRFAVWRHGVETVGAGFQTLRQAENEIDQEEREALERIKEKTNG